MDPQQSVTEILDVNRSPHDRNVLWGFAIDRPRKGDIIENEEIVVAGWVLGKSSPVKFLKILCNDTILYQKQASIPRPDVARVYPQVSRAASSGFHIRVAREHLPNESEIILVAILENGTQCQIGMISFRRLDSLSEIDVCSSSEVELQKSSSKLQEIRQEIKQLQTHTKSTEKVGSNFPLAAIVCGYERGGTTLLAELLRQHPQLDSGFEVGLLLGEKPGDFIGMEPYYSMLKAGWQVNDAEIKYICQAENWTEAYTRLLSKAKVIQNKDVFLFDKTPKYMQVLPEVLKKVPGVPCIVIVRDPRSVLCSWAKRSGVSSELWIQKNIERACNRYNSYAQGWKTAIDNGYKNQILLVQYEELCQNPIQKAEKIFDFIGLDFDTSYVHFTPQWSNVYEGKVSNKYMTEYKKYFSDKICKIILEKTYPSRKWFLLTE